MDPIDLSKLTPEQIAKAAQEWESFFAAYKNRYPKIENITSREAFLNFLNLHRELNVDRNIWAGKEAMSYFSRIQEAHEQEQMEKNEGIDPSHEAADFSALAYLPIAILLRKRPRIIEEDDDFKEIKDKKLKEWQKQNPGKSLESREAIDYIHGSLSNPGSPSLHQDAEEEFKNNKKFAKRIEKYDKEKKKFYKNQNDDPSVIYLKKLIQEEINARKILLDKENSDEENKKLELDVRAKHYKSFVENHPEKAKTYADKNPDIQSAYHAYEINNALANNQKDIRFVEKKKRDDDNNKISQDQARRILEELNNRREIEQVEEQIISRQRGNIREFKQFPEQQAPPQNIPRQPRPQSFDSGAINRINGAFNRFGGAGRTGANAARAAGQGAARAAGGAARAGAGAASRLALVGAGGLSSGVIIAIVIGIVLLIVIIIIVVIGPKGGGGNTSATEITTTKGGDITSCTFYRSGVGNVFGNPKTAQLISDVSAKVGVPASIIAGIMRVESQQALSTTDTAYLENDIDNHFSKDENGNPIAVGVMQFTPGTFIGTFNRNKNEMASLFGKTDVFAEIEPTNLPDTTFRINHIKDSIIATAFKVRGDKQVINGDGPWDKETVAAIAAKYYGTNKDGTTNYKGPDGSTQNYGDDLWQSVINCRLSSGFVGGVAPNPSEDYQTLHDDILKEFNIDFSGYNPSRHYNYLKWAWEKLWYAKNTNFLKLANPQNTTITIKNTTALNEQLSCSSIGIRGLGGGNVPYYESLFKYVLLHEMGHLIENCSSNEANKTVLQKEVIDKEGYISNFAQHSNICVNDINLNEDFADMVSYYLNPDIKEQTLGIGQQCEPVIPDNPYSLGKTLHKTFVENLLGVSSFNQDSSSEQISTPSSSFSCPVVGGGKNRLPSYKADPVNGHCGSNYNLKLNNPADVCSGDTRRGKSIDIETGGTTGKDVELPTIGGKSVNWKYLQNISLSRDDCFEDEILDPTGPGGGCGIGYVFKTDLENGDNWVIHLLHMAPTDLIPGQTYPSGTLVGKTQAIHVHISVGQNIQNVLSQNESGWKSADKDLNICSSN